jgi:DNA-binding NtrC family response regulator
LQQAPVVNIVGDLFLLVIADGQLSCHPLTSAAVRIGRSSPCEVMIDHPSLSPSHAMIRIGSRCTIEDLASATGGRIKDRPLVPMEPVEVAIGELVELGSVLVMVQRRPAAVASVPGARRDGRDANAVLAAAIEAMHGAAASDDVHVPRGALPSDHPAIERIAAGTISVLILGETGVGKEILAERIHRSSPRAGRPLIRFNCAALSEGLLESELFGHERGAFTGATTAKLGLIEAAEGGTVFLDEIGELSMSMQVKLLRVLEAREILPVGGVRSRAVDVRFVSATHVDLEAEIERGGFRADLYYRLNGVTLYVRPLRLRVREIAGLADTFIAHACSGLGRTRCPVLSPEALHLLERYRWPGNIRELRNVIERAVLFCTADLIRPDHLPAETMNVALRRARPTLSPAPTDPRAATAAERVAGAAVHERPRGEAMTVQRELEMLEKQRILQALETCAGNQSRAAKLLSIPRRTFLKRLDAYGIPRPRKPASGPQGGFRS